MKKQIILLITLLFILSGCTEEVTTYTVSFNTNGGTEIEAITVVENTRVGMPEDPTQEGHVFAGWFTDEELTVEFDDEETIVKDTTVYAKFNTIKAMYKYYYKDLLINQGYIEYGQVIELPDLTPTGFTFNGWYSDKELTNEITSITGGKSNIEFYIGMTFNEVVIEDEGDIDLTEYAYYDYLNVTNPVVTITVKNVGVMTLELFPLVARNTVNNFITHIQNEDYTNNDFHRVIDGFVIQGGQLDDPGCSIQGAFESNGISNDLKHTTGVISMARTNLRDSASSQFFIMDSASTPLDGEYAAFGGLTSGFNVLEYISGVLTVTGDIPLEPVIIESITVELNGYVVDDVVCID